MTAVGTEVGTSSQLTTTTDGCPGTVTTCELWRVVTNLVGTTTGLDHETGTTTAVEMLGTATVYCKVLWSGSMCDDGTVVGTLCHETTTTVETDEMTICWVSGNVDGKS